MTKPKTPNPQPTSGTNYEIYLWPRSKNERMDKLYQGLHDLGWRYDSVRFEWYTPEDEVHQARGRMEWGPGSADPDFTWACIRPPRPANVDVQQEPIIEFNWIGGGGVRGYWEWVE